MDDDDWFFNPEDKIKKPERVMELFERERHFMVNEGYRHQIQKAKQREMAVNIIVRHSSTERVGVFVPYLAMIYFDQYLSDNEVPTVPRTLIEDVDVLATCCLAIASKMKNIAFNVTNFLMEQELEYEIGDIVEIETLIDSWLDTRNCKRPVTAFCFLDYFIGKLTYLTEDEMIRLKNFATHKLFALQCDMRFTQFSPSIMAAVAISSSTLTFYKDELAYVNDTLVEGEQVNEDSFLSAIYLTVPEAVTRGPASPDSVAGGPSSSSNTAAPIPQSHQNLDSAAAKADNATTEASAVPDVAPKLELQGSESSSDGSSSNTERPILPPSVLRLPPRKRPVTADQETTDKSSTDQKGKKMAD